MSRLVAVYALIRDGLRRRAAIETKVPNIESILASAVEITAVEERQRYVEHCCGGDEALRARVQELIENHFRAGSFLESPAAGFAATIDLAITPETPGTVIGSYKLLQQIGEGGMGAVYMAEQTQPVQRKVALKLMKPGMDSRQVLARFEAERQALALMDHPNIAKVLDAGSPAATSPAAVRATLLRDGAGQRGAHHPLLR